MSKALPKGMSIKLGQQVTVVTLYQTEIVTIDHIKKSLILRTGGWKTKHTKKCINLVLAAYNIKVIQKDFEWFIMRNSGTIDVKATVFQNDTLEVTLD